MGIPTHAVHPFRCSPFPLPEAHALSPQHCCRQWQVAVGLPVRILPLGAYVARVEIGAAVAGEPGIDTDLAHLVYDDRDAAASAAVQRVVEQRRLAGAGEAGEHGYGKPWVV